MTTLSEEIRAAFAEHNWTVEGLQDDLTREQAVDFLQGFLRKLNESVPASPLALTTLDNMLQVINGESGAAHTVESVAEACGVDLDSATRADEKVMAEYVGGLLST